MKNANPVWMLSLLLLVATGAQAAKVYSWIDSQGVVHYTDAPPPGQKAKEVDLRVAPFIGSSPRPDLLPCVARGRRLCRWFR